MTIQEATKIVYMIHAAYPQDRKATEAEIIARVQLYAAEFADYKAEIVTEAARHLIRTSKYIPSTAELIRAAQRFNALGIQQPRAHREMIESHASSNGEITDEDRARALRVLAWLYEDEETADFFTLGAFENCRIEGKA